jgi:hypothetical protein
MCRKSLTIAACCGLVACAHPPAHANVTESLWISSNAFLYRIKFVPDFDQRRSTLPADGAMYCLPTSIINWAGYIARRGNAGLPPGAPPWAYNITSLNIATLGGLMFTDPVNGTGGTNGLNGANAWLSDYAFVFNVHSTNYANYPRVSTMANWAINANALIAPGISWMDETDFPRITREGGHVVSMVRAARSADQYVLGIHDPAWSPSGDTLQVQSTFTMNTYNITNTVVLVGSNSFPSVLSRIDGYGGTTSQGYITAFYAIVPFVALTPAGPSFTLHQFNLGNILQPDATTFTNPSGGQVTNAFFALDPTQIIYTADNQIIAGGKIARFDIPTNTHTTLFTYGDDFVDACSSRLNRVFAYAGRTLTRINPEEGVANPVEASLVIGTGIDAIAYDDNTDQVVGMRSATRQLVRIPGDLTPGATPATQPIPTQVPVGPGGSIDIRFGDGSVLIATPASTSAYLLTPTAAAGFAVQTISIPGNIFPITGGSFTDKGVMLVSLGRTKELVPDGMGGWTLLTGSPFANLTTSGKVYAGRSRTNVDYAEDADPLNINLLPTVFTGATHERECPADLNGDGVVNFVDLNAVLTSFGQTGPNLPGDTDGDGDVDFTDLNNALTNFGVDCG